MSWDTLIIKKISSERKLILLYQANWKAKLMRWPSVKFIHSALRLEQKIQTQQDILLSFG